MKTRLRTAATCAVLLFAGFAAACASSDADSNPASSGDPASDQRAHERVSKNGVQQTTLFDRLGGTDHIRALVDDFTARSMEDPRVNFDRKGVKTNWMGAMYHEWNPTPEHVEAMRAHFVQFISLASGGPTTYTGRDLHAVHHGMQISNHEFDAMLGDIKATLDKFKVGANEQKEFLAIMETTRKGIVENK